MGLEGVANEALEAESKRAGLEPITAFHQALDQRYRELREAAAADWQGLFPQNDPADAAVSVQVAPKEESSPSARAGIIRPGRARHLHGKIHRRLA